MADILYFPKNQRNRMGIIEKEPLTPAEFEKLFGFPPKKSLTPEHLIECRSVNQLFDDMQDRLKKGSWQIFCAVFKDEENAKTYHSIFLRNVASCPSRVLIYCRKELGFIVEEEKKVPPP
ncbi:MAG: hypothetical protein Q7R54_03270 [bacterium]|nr:hypothetical protein [bacterium]